MLYKFIEILISAIVLIPVFVLLNRTMFHNIRKTVLYFVFAVYLAAVYLFVGMPTPASSGVPSSAQLFWSADCGS